MTNFRNRDARLKKLNPFKVTLQVGIFETKINNVHILIKVTNQPDHVALEIPLRVCKVIQKLMNKLDFLN